MPQTDRVVSPSARSTTNPLDETTTSSMDDAGRLVAVSDPLSQVTSYAYDANGNQVSVTDPKDF